MVPLDALYPAALATANIAAGWVLYALLESVFGTMILVLGVLVLLTVLTETANHLGVRSSVGN